LLLLAVVAVALFLLVVVVVVSIYRTAHDIHKDCAAARLIDPGSTSHLITIHFTYFPHQYRSLTIFAAFNFCDMFSFRESSCWHRKNIKNKKKHLITIKWTIFSVLAKQYLFVAFPCPLRLFHLFFFLL